MPDDTEDVTGAAPAWRSSQPLVASAAFLSLFGIVGIAFYGLPFFYDFMTREYGWSRAVVTSGNALGKLLVGPLFGFVAGWLIDRYGPRRLMASGALLAGLAGSPGLRESRTWNWARRASVWRTLSPSLTTRPAICC